MMSHVTTSVLLAVFIVSIKVQTETTSCGRLTLSLMLRMTDTYETHHWPWHAAIYHQYNKTFDPIYQCGGTLISSKFILTAAHCLCINDKQLDAEIISVSLGRLDLDAYESSNQSAMVTEIILHPNYNSTDFANDIAIVRLSADVVFNDYVQPVCLWEVDRIEVSEVIGKMGTVVGWGLTGRNQKSNVLREASMPVVPWDICLKSRPDIFGPLLTSKHFCAGRRNGTSVCLGDSGGSMTFVKNGIYYIRGIVSLSPSKTNKITHTILCDSWEYAVFTDVAHYLPWIRDTTTITYCETVVRCYYKRIFTDCSIEIQSVAQKCKIIFDVLSNEFTSVTIASGEFDVIPDLSDATVKFENLVKIDLNALHLRTIERYKLSPFKRQLKILLLAENEIVQLDVDTFDDLNKLERLDLGYNNLEELEPATFRGLRNLQYFNLQNNKLNVVHPNIFKELNKLEQLKLNGNQLEILPRLLFRNNKDLKQIELQNNKIHKIEIDFTYPNMIGLTFVNLEGNVCINEYCRSTRLFYELNELIVRDCTN